MALSRASRFCLPPWERMRCSISFSMHSIRWPPRVMQCAHGMAFASLCNEITSRGITYQVLEYYYYSLLGQEMFQRLCQKVEASYLQVDVLFW